MNEGVQFYIWLVITMVAPAAASAVIDRIDRGRWLWQVNAASRTTEPR